MIENGNVIVYDYDGNSGKFLSVGIFDSAESVSYEWSAFNVGQFSIQARDDVPNANLLTRGRVVRIGGKATGIITTRKETLSQSLVQNTFNKTKKPLLLCSHYHGPKYRIFSIQGQFSDIS